MEQIETALIAPFNELSSADVDRAGGKGANLGELVRAGLPVPPGFVITTAAYDQFVTIHHLDAVIGRALQAMEGGGANSGAAIREAIEAAPIPAETSGEILRAYAALGQGPVAVRSSATAEDLPGAAFAGQQETYLNILGDAALLDAVRRCWASLWGDRAMAYRQHLGVDQHNVKLAVVVQKMAAAEFAGVLFTANPVSGARDETVLDANPGLGEAVVSGLVTPDHYVLHRGKWGWSITERRPGRREVMIRALPGGGTEQVGGSTTAGMAALPDRALRKLARLGQTIQRHFGLPQDIEWAWVEGQAFILQARPMTAVPEPPPRATLPQRLLASNFGEMLPTRPYPLDLDTWLPALSAAVEPLFWVLGLRWSLQRMFMIEDGVVQGFNSSLPRPTWKTLFAPARLVFLGLRYNPLHWQADPLLAETLARARALEARDVRVLSWAELLEMVSATRTIPLDIAGKLRLRYFPRAVFAAIRLRLWLGLLGQADKFGVLLWSTGNKTLETNHALEHLAAQARSDPELARIFGNNDPRDLEDALAAQPAGRAFLRELETFFESYGHRETTVSTALQPTWKDAPEMVLGMVKSFAAHPP